MKDAPCNHFAELDQAATPTSTVCDRCIAMGDTWVHLRYCLVCGMVGCCDNSKNRHARAHWNQEGHTLIGSLEPGETWLWCFEDAIAVE